MIRIAVNLTAVNPTAVNPTAVNPTAVNPTAVNPTAMILVTADWTPVKMKVIRRKIL